MKHLIAIAAGLGYDVLERRRFLDMAGLTFRPAESVFPAVTCVAQATFRTAAPPCDHGMVSNGYFSRKLRKPSFWEQSASLVTGPRIWDSLRAGGAKVGMYFWQQSLGESVDYVLSPAPIHKHGGGMIMRSYTQPAEMDDVLNRRCGTFPLHRYWGPLASPKVGRAVLANFFAMAEVHEPDIAFLYLPTLDYQAQRHGPASRSAWRALREFRSQLEKLADFAESKGAELTVCGDYAIGAVDLPPAFPNATLRREGLFSVRPVEGRAYPDFYSSRAFAMCDHEIAQTSARSRRSLRPLASTRLSSAAPDSTGRIRLPASCCSRRRREAGAPTSGGRTRARRPTGPRTWTSTTSPATTPASCSSAGRYLRRRARTPRASRARMAGAPPSRGHRPTRAWAATRWTPSRHVSYLWYNFRQPLKEN